ncbi:hypothetical protein ONS95_010935 [Cadophora gregata]|uniref:uncharacterized protein n=1 Tax=Cadophora gregata TaxID=51156 RepID=UPI0026DD01AF|nr:uncharacterized protein ONS95_010935 [Cadophora gregata]KAK0119488.1 hypothetical protein ONS95_010935 [Cadophora gregata]KAK0120530.1 hypothetical protein ONS96_010737 [Cadophora gregata f. sp. sojae]
MEKQMQQTRVSNIVREEFHRTYKGNGSREDHNTQPTFDGQWPPSEHYLAGLAAYATNLDPSVDLSNPSIPYYGTLRLYSLQHMCQELSCLSRKTLDDANASWHDLERLRTLLHDQAVAMKDLEYINEHLLGVSEQAFINTAQNLRDNNLSAGHHSNGWLYSAPSPRSVGGQLQTILQGYLPKWITWSSAEKKLQPAYYAKGKAPTKVSTAVRVISSTILSLCSGASIIVPMIVMSFNASKEKSLIVVSVAVVLFGFVLGAIVQAKSENVFIATATYAAVLVVFVGVSGSNN